MEKEEDSLPDVVGREGTGDRRSNDNNLFTDCKFFALNLLEQIEIK